MPMALSGTTTDQDRYVLSQMVSWVPELDPHYREPVEPKVGVASSGAAFYIYEEQTTCAELLGSKPYPNLITPLPRIPFLRQKESRITLSTRLLSEWICTSMNTSSPKYGRLPTVSVALTVRRSIAL